MVIQSLALPTPGRYYLNQNTHVDVSQIRKLLRVSVRAAAAKHGCPFAVSDVLRQGVYSETAAPELNIDTLSQLKIT